MSVEERLSRLTPKTQSFSDSGGGFDTMSPQELAACLSGSPPIGEYIVWRRYVDHKSAPGYGYGTLLRLSVMRVDERLGTGKGMVQPVLNAALSEYVGDMKCKYCEGRGKIISNNGLESKCRSTRCSGGRVYSLNGRELATVLGVSYDVWRAKYMPIYDIIHRMISEEVPPAESQAIGNVIRRMRDDTKFLQVVK